MRALGTVVGVACVALTLPAGACAGGDASADPRATAPTKPPGFRPLSDRAAGARVRRRAEIHPGNARANHVRPTRRQIAAFRAASHEPYTRAVTGAFRGTTDEIIQWAAWKWGLNTDVVRAAAVQESDWDQGTVGDGGVTFGLLQVKTQLATGNAGWPGTFPLARRSTAFNADYYGRAFRSCLNGRERWLGRRYRRGDVWGCVGLWYSGDWYDRDAIGYIKLVKRWFRERRWQDY
jgi:hypothetical protein